MIIGRERDNNNRDLDGMDLGKGKKWEEEGGGSCPPPHLFFTLVGSNDTSAMEKDRINKNKKIIRFLRCVTSV